MRGNNNRFFYEVDCSKDSAMAIAISTVFKTLIGKHEGFKQLMKSVFADYKVCLLCAGSAQTQFGLQGISPFAPERFSPRT